MVQSVTEMTSYFAERRDDFLGVPANADAGEIPAEETVSKAVLLLLSDTSRREKSETTANDYRRGDRPARVPASYPPVAL